MSTTLRDMQTYYDEKNTEYLCLMNQREAALIEGRYADAKDAFNTLNHMSWALTAVKDCMQIVRSNERATTS